MCGNFTSVTLVSHPRYPMTRDIFAFHSVVSAVFLLCTDSPRLQAQVALDGTLAPAGALRGPHYRIIPAHGQQIGPHLFHSFHEFNVAAGESATFTGPTEIKNILARVTGGGLSTIDGPLRSEIPGANLYLLNPAGLIFGPNASLDLTGSFVASTADYLTFADKGRFDARQPADSVLTSAPIEAFGFLGAQPAPIQVNSAILAVPTDQALQLVGGEISLNSSGLQAPGGQISLLSVSEPGEILANPELAQSEPIGSGGAISMQNGSVIHAGTVQPLLVSFLNDRPLPVFPIVKPLKASSTSIPGHVLIRGGRLVMEDSAIYQTTSKAPPQTGKIEVQLGRDLSARNCQILTSAYGPEGLPGRVEVNVGRLTLLNQAGGRGIVGLGSRSVSAKPPGEVVLNAQHILVDGQNVWGTFGGQLNSELTAIVSINSTTEGSIRTPLLTLIESEIRASALAGNGGNIHIGAEFLISSVDSIVDASSQRALDGQISIVGPAVDLSGNLTPLTTSLLSANTSLPEHCGSNLGGEISSFLVLGRNGLPLQPGGWQPAPILPLFSESVHPGNSLHGSKECE